jgi:hypothetical protein
VEVEIEHIDPEKTVILHLAELSRKTGLIVRAVEPATVERLFAEIEKYDSHERAETFEYPFHLQIFITPLRLTHRTFATLNYP